MSSHLHFVILPLHFYWQHYGQLYQFATFKSVFYFLLHYCSTDAALSVSQTHFNPISSLTAADIALYFPVPLPHSYTLPSAPAHLKFPLANLYFGALLPAPFLL